MKSPFFSNIYRKIAEHIAQNRTSSTGPGRPRFIPYVFGKLHTENEQLKRDLAVAKRETENATRKNDRLKETITEARARIIELLHDNEHLRDAVRGKEPAQTDKRAIKIVQLQEELEEAKKIITDFVWPCDGTTESHQRFQQKAARFAGCTVPIFEGQPERSLRNG